jgi:ABC-type multidrug transport system ATPase subunit
MRLDDVWLRYGRRSPWVLCEASAQLPPGGAVVVLGRNGVGKSTLLQLAAGALWPSRGAVRDRPEVVGWVPERFPADQPQTVRGYLTAMGGIRGLRGEPLSRAVSGWADRLGLGPYLEVRLPALSKGTAQKVGLAQAVLRSPGLLILDEPWEGLDEATRDLVPELVAEVRAAGGAVLVSDHRGETARLPGAARWVLADGRLQTIEEEDGGGYVIEVEASAAQAAATVARLRADGHRVLRVRQR